VHGAVGAGRLASAPPEAVKSDNTMHLPRAEAEESAIAVVSKDDQRLLSAVPDVFSIHGTTALDSRSASNPHRAANAPASAPVPSRLEGNYRDQC
jgi:hypothetical protein